MSKINAEIDINVNTDGLDKAIEKVEHLIELLTRIEQLNSSLKGFECKTVIPDIKINISNPDLVNPETVAENVKRNIVSELKCGCDEKM